MKDQYLTTIAVAMLLSVFSYAAEMPPEPKESEEIDAAQWAKVTPGLHSGFGSLDVAYSKSQAPPHDVTESLTLRGWKGERVQAMFLVWTADQSERVDISIAPFEGNKATISKDCVAISTVRYVYTNQFITPAKTTCGPRDSDSMLARLSPDLLSGESGFVTEKPGTRPVWIAVDIPRDAVAGTYTGAIIRTSPSGTVRHPLTLVVQDKVLPPASEWAFHLDLWQNPFIVARYYGVELWSEEHLALLRPLLRMLADAGQKCITATIVHKPWDFEDYQSMVSWTHKADGNWAFDYTIFDLYVSLAMECGISKQINCYSLLPIPDKFYWFDEASGKTVTSEAGPGTEEYTKRWSAFLVNFREHLKEKGWLERTALALDERGPEAMLAVFKLIKETTPEFKIALAGVHHDDITENIYDFSSNWRDVGVMADKFIEARRKEGKITTFYVACAVTKPNNFTFSPPAESCYQGWFASANGFDGFLRWAYNSWPENGLIDSRHTHHPPGDTFMVYPGARSSIRFERMREGIQEFEKIRILRKQLAADPSKESADSLATLNRFLTTIHPKTLDTKSAAEVINEGKALLDRIVTPIP